MIKASAQSMGHGMKRKLRDSFTFVIRSFLLIGLSGHALGAEKNGQRCEALPLWADQTVDRSGLETTIQNGGVFKQVTNPCIMPYLPPEKIANGTSLLICPGGGYNALDWNSHVERLAPLFTSKGIAVIGLRYRTTHPDNQIPEDPLKDFDQAIRLIRENAEEWNLDAERIVGLGFSAGSNLLLQYACISEGEKINYLSFLCLWPYGRGANDYFVKKRNMDVILFTTEEDHIAPFLFSEEVAEQLKKLGSRVQHITYPEGDHMAFNFYSGSPKVDWTGDFLKWLETKGLLDK